MSRRSVSFMMGAFVALLAIGSVVAFERHPGRTVAATDYKQLADAAKNVYDLRLALRSLNSEAITVDELYLWSTRWMEAESAVSADAESRARKAHLDRMLRLETATRELGKVVPAADVAAAVYY